MSNDPLDDLFHFCALQAFLDESYDRQAWPDEERTRQRAYALFEDLLAEKNGRPRRVAKL